LSIDAAILKVLNGDPTASLREIAQEAELSASTVFYVLTTRLGDIY
jgi:DNA-binding Lrp family transcriptional regulator